MSKVARSCIYGVGVALLAAAFCVPVDGPDGEQRRQMVEALWQHGTLISSVYDFGTMAILLPFYAIATLFKTWARLQMPLGDLAHLLNGSVLAGVTSGVLFWIGARALDELRLSGDRRHRALVWVGAIALFANPLFYTSERALIELPQGLLILVTTAAVLSREPDGVATRALLVIGPALSILVKGPSGLIWLPCFVEAIRRSRSRAAALGAGMLLGAAGTAWWNIHRTGTIFGSLYGAQGFSTPVAEGMYAFLLSPGLSIFLFSPLTIWGVQGLWRRTKRREPYAIGIACGFVAYFVLISAWCVYDGGLSYGPRLMLPLLPALVGLGMPGFLTFSQGQDLAGRWSRIVRGTAAGGLVLWSGLLQFNSVLFPYAYHWNEWRGGANVWSIPVAERQIRLDFAERLAVFDPSYSHTLGNLPDFFRRRDLWEVPFLNFANRALSIEYVLRPQRAVQDVAFISFGGKADRWEVAEVSVTSGDRGQMLPFALEPASQWSENLDAARDGSRWTFASIGPLRSGIELLVHLDAPRQQPFRVVLDYGRNHLNLPHAIVVQEHGGAYFGGNLNDPSFIPHDVVYHASLGWPRANDRVVVVIVGALLLAMALSWKSAPRRES